MTRNTQDADKRLIATVVWFANAKLKSTAEVERRFEKAIGNPIGTIGPEQLDAYRNDQQRCREMLAKALSFDRRKAHEREWLAQNVTRLVTEKVYIEPRPTYSRGRFQLEWKTHVLGVESAIAYAVLLLLGSPREKLRRRFGRCAYEECSNFFFDERLRGGEEKLYCTPNHSAIGRVRQSRRRKKAKGEAR